MLKMLKIGPKYLRTWKKDQGKRIKIGTSLKRKEINREGDGENERSWEIKRYIRLFNRIICSKVKS